MPATRNREIIVAATHRGLRYRDGALTDVLEAGRYRLPRRLPFRRGPVVEIALVDMRERELTIKGQEILTSDKVAVRVSILTQFKVVDPVAALQKVIAYEDRLYSDVQLAARRSLRPSGSARRSSSRPARRPSASRSRRRRAPSRPVRRPRRAPRRRG